MVKSKKPKKITPKPKKAPTKRGPSQPGPMNASSNIQITLTKRVRDLGSPKIEYKGGSIIITTELDSADFQKQLHFSDERIPPSDVVFPNKVKFHIDVTSKDVTKKKRKKAKS